VLWLYMHYAILLLAIASNRCYIIIKRLNILIIFISLSIFNLKKNIFIVFIFFGIQFIIIVKFNCINNRFKNIYFVLFSKFQKQIVSYFTFLPLTKYKLCNLYLYIFSCVVDYICLLYKVIKL